MAEVNPILRWDKQTLTKLIEQSEQDAELYDFLSKVTHFFIGFFGISALVTFGVIGPSYTATTGTLIIVGYGPACDVSIEAWKALAKNAVKEADKYRNIRENHDKVLTNVPELQNRQNLIAQWYALELLPKKPFTPPEKLNDPQEGKDTCTHYLESINVRIENCRRKIYRAYLIHAANHPFDLRKVRDFGVFYEWSPEHVTMGIPFAVFKSLTIDDIEALEPARLEKSLFSS